ncbi:hypothetical protein GCM10027570_21140 [Streptomonospora sediminis]
MTAEIKGNPISREEFDRLFSEFRYTAFRLETFQTYSSAYDTEPFRRFMADDLDDYSPTLHAWGEKLRADTAAGRTYSRVHVVTEPLTDYMRFECAWGYRPNAEAGENIRILAVKEGDWPEGIPAFDYWLFDSHRLVSMTYADDGSLQATGLVDDSEQVVAANVWRDRANYLSVPFAEYQARFDTYMRPL